MKIGIYYSVTAKGFDSKSVKLNEGTWCEVVDDYRDDWQRHTATTDGVGVAMKIVQDGVVFAVIQMLKGSDRPDNNITTWVYISNKLKIKGSQIKDIISEVKEINKLPTKNVAENTFLDRGAIGQNYPEKQHACSITPSNGEGLAVRYPAYGFSMAEIYGNPFQTYYAKYKFVFLYEEKKPIAEGIVDLSKEELVETICVLRPSDAKIEELFGAKDVRLQPENGVLESVMCKKKGERLRMKASRVGYAPNECMAVAKNDGEELV